MKKTILSGFLVAATIGLLSTGCRKDKTDASSDTDTEFASNNAQGESISNDAVNYADAAARQGSGTGSFRLSGNENILGACAMVTLDSIQRKIVIDFGTGCTNASGNKTRKGKILISYTGGSYWTTGSVKTITFDGYYVNNRHVEGSKSVTNNGTNSAGHLNWTINADLTVTNTADGKVFTWKSTRNREMTAGDSTPFNLLDDVYSITGTASGSNKRGVDYTATIVKPLVRQLSCEYIGSGSIDLVVGTKPIRTFDFGNGDCDNKATVTINGNTYNITL